MSSHVAFKRPARIDATIICHADAKRHLGLGGGTTQESLPRVMAPSETTLHRKARHNENHHIDAAPDHGEKSRHSEIARFIHSTETSTANVSDERAFHKRAPIF